MTYKAIDIPFFTGQDESFDKKLLPIGPLQRVENAYLERSGRMVEKYGLVSRSTTNLDGGNLSSLQFRNTLGDDLVTVQDGGGIFAAKYADDGVNLLGGRNATALGYETTLTAVGTDVGSQTWSPSVAVTSTHVIFAYVAGRGQNNGTHHVIDIYTRDELKLVRRLVRDAGTGSQIKVGSNANSKSFVIAYKGNNSLQMTFMADETADWGSSDANLDTVRNSSFDVSFAIEDNSFGVCVLDNGDGECRIHLYEFSATLPEIFTYAFLPFEVDEEQSVLCGCALVSQANFLFACSYYNETDGTYQVDRSAVMGTQSPTFRQSHTNNVGAPCISVHGTSREFVLAYAAGATTWTRVIRLDNTERYTRNTQQCWPASCSHTVSNSDSEGDPYGYIAVGEWARQGANTGDNRGAVSIISPGNDHRFGNPCGVLLKAGGSNYTRSRVGQYKGASSDTTGQLVRWTPAKVATAGRHVFFCIEQRLLGGIGQTVVGTPNVFEMWETFSSVRVLINRTQSKGVFSEPWEGGGAVASGAAVSVVTDPVNHFAGFTGAPGVRLDSRNALNFLADGVYKYLCILEYRDPKGRLWRSIPSGEQQITVTDTGLISATIPIYDALPCAGAPVGTVKVVYRTEAGGDDFFRLATLSYDQGEQDDFVVDGDLNPQDDPLAPGRPPYTADGSLSHEPPPLGRFIARTRNRFWVGRQESASRVQASQFLVPGLGISWSNLDNYAVDMPEDVTGLAATDDALVVFGANGIYIVHGEGPNLQGIGSFAAVTKIPTDSGCVQPRSIITADDGVFFISARGIELLDRAWSAPQFVGRAVEDVTDRLRFCEGVIVLQEVDQIRWLMTNGVATQGRQARVIVYDVKKKAWSVFNYNEGPGAFGRAKSNDNTTFPLDGAAHYGPTLGTATQETYERNATVNKEMIWETGFIRPAGLNANALGRRLHILGTFKADCAITIEMAFNDAKDFHPTWVKTWNLTSPAYAADDPVQLELTLPQQKFDSVRFRLTASRTNAGPEAFQAHGLTVYVSTEGEGPRVGAGSKG